MCIDQEVAEYSCIRVLVYFYVISTYRPTEGSNLDTEQASSLDTDQASHVQLNLPTPGVQPKWRHLPPTLCTDGL